MTITGVLPRQVSIDATPQRAEQRDYSEYGSGFGTVPSHRVHRHCQHTGRSVPPPLRCRERHVTVMTMS